MFSLKRQLRLKAAHKGIIVRTLITGQRGDHQFGLQHAHLQRGPVNAGGAGGSLCARAYGQGKANYRGAQFCAAHNSDGACCGTKFHLHVNGFPTIFPGHANISIRALNHGQD